MKLRWMIGLFLAGDLVGSARIVYDELLSVNRYACCQYPIPFLGTFDTYVASYLPFSMIFAGFLLMAVSVHKLSKPQP